VPRTAPVSVCCLAVHLVSALCACACSGRVRTCSYLATFGVWSPLAPGGTLTGVWLDALWERPTSGSPFPGRRIRPVRPGFEPEFIPAPAVLGHASEDLGGWLASGSPITTASDYLLKNSAKTT